MKIIIENKIIITGYFIIVYFIMYYFINKNRKNIRFKLSVLQATTISWLLFVLFVCLALWL